MMYRYKTQGTCSVYIDLELENGIIKDVIFHGGCDGNLQGICQLVKGMPAKEVSKKLEGIDCNGKGTSCPDQLANAIRLVSAQLQAEEEAARANGSAGCNGCCSSCGSSCGSSEADYE